VSGLWPGVGVSLEGDSDSGPYLSHLDFYVIFVCNFVAVNLTRVQFILQLKLCLYTIVNILLE